jgi:predicted ABC-type ATPase
MPATPPTIYLVAGCNGAGKTTFARQFLPAEVQCLNFLNADYLAQGLSPLDPETAAMRAGRLVVAEIRRLLRRRQSFAVESTLSGITYLRWLRRARHSGYRTVLIYLWLPNPALAIRRIRQRVLKGGHSVPVAVVRRRFTRSLRHLFRDYLPLASEWLILDNRGEAPQPIAHGSEAGIVIHDRVLYEWLVRRSR